MEEDVEREEGFVPLDRAKAPDPLNCAAAFLALGGEGAAKKVASAFSCAAFSVSSLEARPPYSPQAPRNRGTEGNRYNGADRWEYTRFLPAP